MINRTMIDDDFLGLDSSMKAPVVTSAILHIILFIVTAFGIPFIARDHEILSQPISIEIVPIDELTQTNRVATPVKPKEEKKELPPPVQNYHHCCNNFPIGLALFAITSCNWNGNSVFNNSLMPCDSVISLPS